MLKVAGKFYSLECSQLDLNESKNTGKNQIEDSSKETFKTNEEVAVQTTTLREEHKPRPLTSGAEYQ
uniref:Uncharacterized protein n=1 Tax=Arundo donax TaxID=35708 RepID=A0A0A9B304_ARUDO